MTTPRDMPRKGPASRYGGCKGNAPPGSQVPPRDSPRVPAGLEGATDAERIANARAFLRAAGYAMDRTRASD